MAQRTKTSYSQKDYYIEDKSMFGGLSFLIDGNVARGVMGDVLCVRVGQEGNQETLELLVARQFDFMGKGTSGWIFVSPEGQSDLMILDAQIERGYKFVTLLPEK